MQDSICHRVLKNIQDPALHIAASSKESFYKHTNIYSDIKSPDKYEGSCITNMYIDCTRRNPTNMLDPSSQIHKAEI